MVSASCAKIQTLPKIIELASTELHEVVEMRYLAYVAFLLVLCVISVNSQADASREKHVEPPALDGITEKSQGMELLETALAEASTLHGRMRAWALWQIGTAYGPVDKVKALKLFETALVVAHAVREDSSATGSRPDPLDWITGRPSLSPGHRLEADIARSILLLDPKRADQLLPQIDPAARSGVLLAVLAHQEKEQRYDQAHEMLNRITAQNEMPYEYAMKLMDNLKPEQTGELMQFFSSALSSYSNHAPHTQIRDMFPVLLSRYWDRLPKKLVRQALDEILNQAAEADKTFDLSPQRSYGVSSDKGTTTFRSLYEYRLSQVMPVLHQVDASAAREYEEKYPALGSLPVGTSSPRLSDNPPADPSGISLHPSGSKETMMDSMRQMPMVKSAAQKADSGELDAAITGADAIADPGLRAQTYEYIARVAVRKQDDNAAERALQRMLQIVEKLESKDAFPYYSSAAEVYMQMNQPDDAKKSILAGLEAAGKLYQSDSDDSDPNTALKAFWPSTNAYCAMFRSAGRVSHTWALSLLTNIKDPELKIAAEIALAGGWMNAPIGPTTMMTSKKNANSISLGGRE